MESKVIVIHHGSHSLKIGLASDPSPKTIPNYIARRRKTNKSNNKPVSINNNISNNDSDNSINDSNRNIPATNESVNNQPIQQNENQSTTITEQPSQQQTTTITESEPMKIDESNNNHSNNHSNNNNIHVNNSNDNSEQQSKEEKMVIKTEKEEKVEETIEVEEMPVNISISDSLISNIQQATKETAKLLPAADYIKINQKTTLYNEKNSTTSEIVPETKKKKKKSTQQNAPYQPPPLNYNEIDYCIGEDAIKVSRNKKEWIAYQPIILSTFNTGIYNSSQSMFDDITQMWKFAIQRYLNIPSSDLSSYGCVYVVQDSIDKKNIKTIVSLLFKELQFTSVLLYQESICSTFGMSVSTQTCVIDIGHQKISICCIDEGYLLPNTRVTLKYGSEHLTKLLEYFLSMDESKRVHKYYFPFKSNEIESIDFSPFYLNVFESIKHENLDYLLNDPQKQKVASFKVQDLKQSNQFNIYHFNGDEVYHFVAMSLFYPEILSKFGGGSSSLISNSKLGLVKGDNSGQFSFNYYLSLFDSEDIFSAHPSNASNAIPLFSTLSSTATPTISTTSINSTDNSNSNFLNSSVNNTTSLQQKPSSSASNSSSTAVSPTKKLKTISSLANEGKEIDMPLDTAINKSISQLERSEVNKKKYLSNILLVGGGALMPGLSDTIKARVFKQQVDQQMQLFQQQQQQQQAQQQQIKQAQQNGQPVPNFPPMPQPPAVGENYIGFVASGSSRQDVDLRNASWRGGAILGCLESTKEIWITKTEWKNGFNQNSVLSKLPF